MAGDIPRVNIAVKDRILLHLLEEDDQADRYVVTAALTRPGIAESCAQHPPNVSRAMRTLLRKRLVSEHSRSIRGDDRRQKTWQLKLSYVRAFPLAGKRGTSTNVALATCY